MSRHSTSSINCRIALEVLKQSARPLQTTHSSACTLPRNVALQHYAETCDRFHWALLYFPLESQSMVLGFLLDARLVWRYKEGFRRFYLCPGNLPQPLDLLLRELQLMTSLLRPLSLIRTYPSARLLLLLLWQLLSCHKTLNLPPDVLLAA